MSNKNKIFKIENQIDENLLNEYLVLEISMEKNII